jgi:hypothetical protein
MDEKSAKSGPKSRKNRPKNAKKLEKTQNPRQVFRSRARLVVKKPPGR